MYILYLHYYVRQAFILKIELKYYSINNINKLTNGTRFPTL